MNKVLVRLYVPIIDQQYDIWIPLNKTIHNVIILLSKAINEFQDGNYQPDYMPVLYNKSTGMKYVLTDIVKDTDIINGTELVLL